MQSPGRYEAASGEEERPGCELSWEERAHCINLWLSECSTLGWLSDKLSIQPSILAAICVSWVVAFFFWGFSSELISAVVGLLYPMYATFRALEDHTQANDAHSAAEVSDWLAYWVIYAAITILDVIFYWVLLWVPFYHILRLVFTVWLFLPATRGASTVYAWTVGPVFRRYRLCVDSALAQSAAGFNGALGGEQLRGALRGAALESAGLVRNLGIEELVAQELTKAAAARLASQAASPSRMQGRGTRTASPRPPLSAHRPGAGKAEAD